jgi:hypothetical protein
MQFNLCYKQYDYKLNLAACKSFYEQTGKDLNYTLLCYLEAARETVKLNTVSRLRHFFGLESFDVIAKMLHCMIKQEDKSIPLAEIEDAMFRVGWMPTDEDGDMCEPWPLVVMLVATQVSEYYSEMDKKKVTT